MHHSYCGQSFIHECDTFLQGSHGVTGGHGGSRGVTGVAGEKETKPELNGEVKKTKTIPVNPFH